MYSVDRHPTLSPRGVKYKEMPRRRLPLPPTPTRSRCQTMLANRVVAPSVHRPTMLCIPVVNYDHVTRSTSEAMW